MLRSISLDRTVGFLSVAIIIPLFAFGVSAAYAQSNTSSVQLSFPSRSGTFTTGSTFEIPIFLDTQGENINAVEFSILFDPHKIAVVKPSGDKSIITVWLDPPKYSNTKGTVTIAGSIPNGIVTESGLVTTITFRAIESGETSIRISPDSKVIAHDGSQKNLLTQFDRADYTIQSRLPEGVRVFSTTHPFDDRWYNNNNPIFGWDTEAGITGFSYTLDTEPFTIPDNAIDDTSTAMSYKDLTDGIWYFHLKTLKKGMWGATTHFLVRIDTTSPAKFEPAYEILNTSPAQPAYISFSAIDSHSGIDHYEIGIVERSDSEIDSPIFVPAESPHQIPLRLSGDVRVIVRAFDRAGNVENATLDFEIAFSLTRFVVEHSTLFFGLIIFTFFLFFLLIYHYFVGHHLIHHTRRIMAFIQQERENDH